MSSTSMNVRYVAKRCIRFIQALVSNLRVQGSIQQINNYQHLWINRKDTPHLNEKLSTCLTEAVHYRQEPFKGLNQSLKGVALGVALVLVGALCPVEPLNIMDQQMPITIHELADYQLTDKQYKCHNRIVHRESRGNRLAIGNLKGTKQVHGYYQIKSESIKGADDYYQFWMYWKYVSHRYGITKYDEPNYCKALQHLRTKGWQ